MPLSGPSSYVPTVKPFIAHWVLVDDELGAGNEIILKIGLADNPESVTRTL